VNYAIGVDWSREWDQWLVIETTAVSEIRVQAQELTELTPIAVARHEQRSMAQAV
jgi:hypothetical protein